MTEAVAAIQIVLAHRHTVPTAKIVNLRIDHEDTRKRQRDNGEVIQQIFQTLSLLRAPG